MSCGSPKARAIATRCCCPPAQLRRQRLDACRGRPRRAPRTHGRKRAPARRAVDQQRHPRRFDRGVSVGSRLNCWKTKPIVWPRKRARARAEPAHVLSGDALAVVLVEDRGEHRDERGLAAADGPTSISSSPRRMSRSTPRSARDLRVAGAVALGDPAAANREPVSFGCHRISPRRRSPARPRPSRC